MSDTPIAENRAATEAPFVLDLQSNPHPIMRDNARILRRRALHDSGPDHDLWLGYLSCMIDATGCSALDILRWLDRHDEGDQL